ncbi:MAG: hypothetical protein Q9169_006791 [Polycauliona sp. 2 TL-2023]
MRLLNTQSLEFAEFFDSKVPKYAILSHRWGEREIGFKEILKRTAPPGPALRKIERCCRLAASNGLQWVWIDTCCIDKRSSAELTEAINSMYKWYQRSKVCYVYLNDFQFTPNPSWGGQPSISRWLEEHEDFSQKFSSSLWFTRGWTLQELLAPETLVFFDAEWQEIGTRHELRGHISAATKIPTIYLGEYRVDSKHIRTATKMSFAAHRITSREEDVAYCMLGLFDVNMPLLYGEGAIKAFQRLQVEVIKVSSDESLFAWTSNEPASGMLASRPSCFADWGDIAMTHLRAKDTFRRRFATSNIGLEFPIPGHLPKQDLIPVYLNCYRSIQGQRKDIQQRSALCIQLRVHDDVTFRVRCDTLDPAKFPQMYDYHTLLDLKTELQDTRTIYVQQPVELEVEYSRILSEIEEGGLQFAKLPIVQQYIASSDSQGMIFWNPTPSPIAEDPAGRFINSGDCSPEEEANARYHTFNALMITAGYVLFSGKPRDTVLSQN